MRGTTLLSVAAVLWAALLPLPHGLHADAAEERGPWDEVVFLPEKGLAVLLERDPRGVLLDRSGYLDLHRRAREARGDGTSATPGPSVRLLRCEVEGSVEGDRARLRARLLVVCRGVGRERLPLSLGGSVSGATLDGAPAVLAAGEKGGLELIVRGEGIHEAVVDVVAAVSSRQGARAVAVDLPPAPVSRWTLEIPGRVTATSAESLWRVERLENPDRTRLVAVRPGGALRASWREGDEGTDLPPLVRGTIRTLVEAGIRSANVAALLRLEVSRKPRAEFPVTLPADLQVLGIEGEGASLLPAGEPAGGRTPFTLRFPEPFTGIRTVLLRATRPLEGPGALELPVPDVREAASVDRRLAVRFVEGLRGFVEAGPGAVPLDPALSEQGAVDALLDLGPGASARGVSERASTRLRADVRVLVDLAEDGPWIAASFLYRPLGDRLYGVEPLLPSGLVPDSVTVSEGVAFVRGATPEGRLSLVFPGGVPAGGAVAVAVRGRLPVEGWPSEEWTERGVPLGRIDAGEVEGAQGFLGIAAPPGLDVREEGTEGLEAAPSGDLRSLGGFTAEGLRLGYRVRGRAFEGRVRAVRLAPAVTATVGILAVPAEDHVAFEASIGIALQRSGIREARIAVSPALGDLLRVEGPDVAEKRRIPGEGRDVWVVRFARRVRDGTGLLLRADLPLPKDGAAVVPAVAVEGAARQDLLVGLAGAGELEVSAEASGLREADPADLVPVLGPRSAGLLRAWRGEPGAAPSVRVRVARLPAAPLPPAFADSVALRTVIGMDGIARTRLVARVRNADRQSLEVLLPEGASLRSARVAGEAVRPVRGEEGRVLVPVAPAAEPFEVVLFYEEPAPAGGGGASLAAPRLGIPGAQVVWTVFTPEGSLPMEAGGDFSAPPAPPGTPVVVRILRGFLGGIASVGTLGSGSEVREEEPAAPPAPGAAPAVDAAAGVVAAEAEGASRLGREAEETEARKRIEARTARQGLFGMDIPLLAAGPAVTATRLGPGGTFEVRWRTAAGRTASALALGVLALLLAFAARRRGVPALTWTVLALGLLTALPVLLGAEDMAPYDGAALGTLAFAALVLLGTLRKVRLRRWRPRAAAAAAAFLLALVPASPAEAKGGGGGGRKADAAAPPAAPPADEKVYVPYDPSRPETLRVPERVFLPYERYRELWNAAHPEERIESPAPPVVLAASYDSRVEGRVFVARARFEVDPLEGGFVALPPGAAAEEVLLDGRAVPATAAAPGGTALVPVPRAPAGGRSVLEATLRWPVGGGAPGGIVRAAIPRAPRCRLVAILPLPEAVVDLQAAGGWSANPADGATRVEADLGPADALVLSWQPRGADAAGGRTRFEATTEAAVEVRADRLEWSAATTLRVLSGTLAEVEVGIPPDLEIRTVSGPAVNSWTVAGEGPERRLVIRLASPGPCETKVDLAGSVPGPVPEGGAAVPDPVVRGAAADRHRVAVAPVSGRLAVAASEGMERTDAPAGSGPGRAAWRRVRAPARLVVRSEPFPADLRVASRQHLHLGAAASLLRAELDLEPGPAGLFEARIPLPAGWALEESGAAAAAFVSDGALRLIFRGPPASARRAALLLRGPAAGTEAASFPLLRVEGASREEAELLVSTPPGFAAGASDPEGLEPVPADRFAAWPAVAPDELRSLAWRAPRGPGRVSVRREALRPSLRPTVVADLTVLDDRVIVDALLLWEVRGGLERTFAFLSPPGVRDAWVLGEGIREVRREAAGDRERVTVTLQAPSTGEVAFRALYEVAVPPGGTVEVAGPVPQGGEGARAFLMLRALGDSEVRPEPGEGVEACDVADLPRIPEGLDPRRVLRFYRAREAFWRVPLRLVAHGMGDLPEARVHLVEAVTVVDRDGSSRTRVDARLFNRARSFLPVRLPGDASLESALAAGVPVRPAARPSEPGVLLVPVRVQSLGEGSQVVSLTYATPPAVPGGRFGALEPRLPEFPGVPVDATTWRVLLPADRDYSFGGNLDPVEEVEVRLAQAEAYAEDLGRLRRVVTQGTASQQTVAAENLAENARLLRGALDDARARMDELEKAAAAGLVDPTRLAQGREKAKDLMQDLEQTLAETRALPRTQTAAEGRAAPASGGDGDYRGRTEQIHERYATKEGQADKNWGANRFDPRQARQAEVEREAGKKAEKALLGLGYAGEGKAGTDRAKAAVVAHESFAWKSAPEIRAAEGSRTGGAGGAAGGTAPSSTFYLQGVGGGGGGAGGALHFYLGGAGGGGGGGHVVLYANDALDIRGVPVKGVLSLAPPLVERGRAYAFRRLGTGASLEIAPHLPGLGRRLGALAGLLLLAGLVILVHRRRAART